MRFDSATRGPLGSTTERETNSVTVSRETKEDKGATGRLIVA